MYTARKYVLLLNCYRLIIVLSLLGSKQACAQQEPQTNLYLFNTLYVNPGYTGYKEDAYLHAFYRTQWTGLRGAPQNVSISADKAFGDNKNVGMGISMNQYSLGAQSNLSARFNYAYRLRINDDKNARLAFGISAGIRQIGLDGTKSDPIVPLDPLIPYTKVTKISPDVNFGVYFSNEDFFAGVSAMNLLTNLSRDETIPVPTPAVHFFVIGGFLKELDNGLLLKPSFQFKDDRTGPSSLDISTSVMFGERLWLGGFYRTAVLNALKKNLPDNLQKQSALGLTMEVFVGQKLRIGYSFDYSLNKLQQYSLGSHEISLGIYLTSLRDRLVKCYF